MKAVMVMFDTLSRRFLSTYGFDWVQTPNFERLKKRTLQFDNFYSGSLPCMPARRELHTGRLNFLHRGWGPIEPYDFSAIETLSKHGIYTHIVTDHSHYWEDGGATYLPRYSSWEGFRGQEGDRWQGIVNPDTLAIPKQLESTKQGESFYFNWANRSVRKDENDYSSVQCVHAGLNFIDRNQHEDNWFLQIECFDPHEPFDVPQEYLDLYEDTYAGDYFDWPAYAHVTENEEAKQHVIKRYAALISMCDAYLGKILDKFDACDLWKDTMLIVNTDHGFLMGEHDWWGKNVQPFYQEVAHIPFYFYDPRNPQCNQTTSALCQTIDIAPTLLNYFHLEIPESVTGMNIADIVNGKCSRKAALFGAFGAHINITDGEYVYMRSPLTARNEPLYEYTLMPTRMRGFIKKELTKAVLCDGFSFTQNMKLLKLPSSASFSTYQYGNKLYNLHDDPYQQHALNNKAKEVELIHNMVEIMRQEDAPLEQYERMGVYAELNEDDLQRQRDNREVSEQVHVNFEINKKQRAQINMLKTMVNGKLNVEDALNTIANTKPNSHADEYIYGLFQKIITTMGLPKTYVGMMKQMLDTADVNE